MNAEAGHLNLAAWEMRSRANGPGERFVLWVQGCSRACPGCFNEDMQPVARRHWVTVDQVFEAVTAVPGIEGVTYTGGEPMEQAEPLVRLTERLRDTGLSVVCYTGFTVEELRWRDSPSIRKMLDLVDILIDGPYLREQAESLLWRGSRNQRIHFLTERYAPLASVLPHRGSQVEFVVDGDCFRTTGTWPEGFIEKLQQVLRGDA